MCGTCHSDHGKQGRSYLFVALIVLCALVVIVGVKTVAARGAHATADRCQAVAPLATSYGALLTRDRQRGPDHLIRDTSLFAKNVQRNSLGSCEGLRDVIRSAKSLLHTTCPSCEVKLQQVEGG